MTDTEKTYIRKCFFASSAVLVFFFGAYPHIFRLFSAYIPGTWKTALMIFPFNTSVLAVMLFFSFSMAKDGIKPYQLMGFRPFPAIQILKLLLPLFLFLSVLILILNDAIFEAIHYFKLKLPEQDIVSIFRTGTPETMGLICVSSLVLAPISEELMFRHVFFRYFNEFMPESGAALLTSGLFALIHWNIRFFLPLLVLALILQVAYKKTGSLLAACLIHCAFNLVNLLLLFRQLH